MPTHVKPDTDPKNDYSDGYSAGRRYWTRILKKLGFKKVTKQK